MLMEWINNYEKLFHGIQTDVHTTTSPAIQNLGDDDVRLVQAYVILIVSVILQNGGKTLMMNKDYILTASTRHSTRRCQPPPPPEKSSKDMSFVELMLETGHHDLVQKYFPSTPSEPFVQPPVTHQPIPCIAMLNPYEQEFPPLEKRIDQNTRVPSKPYFVPNTVDAQGNYQATQAEEVLKWQTQNAVCQNTTLKRIDSKLDSLITKTDGLAYQINQVSEEVKSLYLHQRQQAQKLDAELKAFIERGYMGSQFKQKELELQSIQQNLKRIELDIAKKQSQAIYDPYPSFSMIPAPLFSSSPTAYPEEADYINSSNLIIHGSHLGSKGIHISEPSSNTSTPIPPSYSTITSTMPSSQTTTVATPPPHTSAIAELAIISRIAMVQLDEEFAESFVEHPKDDPRRQDHNYKPTRGPWFSFDDIPYEEWRFRLQEFSAWIDLQITAQRIPLKQALQEFVSRFTGTLREWFQNLSPYQKLQAVQVEEAATLLRVIQKEFISDFNIIWQREKQEFFEMKCFSLNRKDL
ncbi:hypothetical protein K1719_017960 [Acacia pycnantha]|nr:hypothetical protein K1719_017960 [Acacia pycnantha]